MNSKVKSIIIGGIVILVLLGVMAFLMLTEKPEEVPETSAPDANVIILWKGERADIERAEVKNEKGGFVAVPDKKDALSIEGLENYDLTVNDIAVMQNHFSTMTATREIEKNPSDISKYGLDNPVAELKVRFKDGSEYGLKLGLKLPTSGGYYALKDGDATVYAVANMDVDEVFYDDVDFINHFLIEEDQSENVVIEWLEIEGANFKDKKLRIAADEKGVMYLESPIEAAMHETNGKRIIEGLYSLMADEIAGVGLNPEYGFGKPYATISYKRNGVEEFFVVGNETKLENGEMARFVKKGDSDVVYRITVFNLPWLEAVPDNLFSTFILLPNINDVDTVEVSASGEVYTFESKGEKETLTATLNGEDITTENYRAMYEFLISASAREINRGANKGELIAKITYKYRDKKRDVDVIEFFASDDRKCILSLNGSSGFLTETRYAEKILTNCVKVANGEKPLLEY